MTTSVDIGVFKTVSRAIASSENPDMMAAHMAQLLVADLSLKGCTIFALNVESDELEILASFGLSIAYLNKGPVFSQQSLSETRQGQTIVITDISQTDRLQYPADAKAEGIGAIVSVPIRIYDRVIGALRFYCRDPWEPSDHDLEVLTLMGEYLGLALMYARLYNAVASVSEIVGDVHSVWMGRK